MPGLIRHRTDWTLQRLRFVPPALVVALCTICTGCYAPLYAPATPAASLPDVFRTPTRSVAAKRNLATLSATRPELRLGPGDVIDVTIPQLYPKEAQAFPPIRVQLTNAGKIHLPEAGAVAIGGLTLSEAHDRINKFYVEKALLRNPTASISVVQLATIDVLVLGEVKNPGVHRLVRGENDVAHALGAAGGLTLDADDCIELHRGNSQFGSVVETAKLGRLRQPHGQRNRALTFPIKRTSHSAPVIQRLPPVSRKRAVGESQRIERLPPVSRQRAIGESLRIERLPPTDAPEAFPARSFTHHTDKVQPPSTFQRGNPPADNGGRGLAPAPGMTWRAGPGTAADGIPSVMKIPLTGSCIEPIPPEMMQLNSGDVVVVPRRAQDVFYVVGRLSTITRTRFGLDAREREIGSGFLIPRDRDIDVVTAVAMAGYIDPIDSPTTVTVHRVLPNQQPLLIKIDLIRARYDRRETIMVQPGDIIYLNPDASWWIRRTFNSVIGQWLGTTFDRRVVLPLP